MTREEAKEVFINRGYVNVKGGTIFDGDKWRQSVEVITEWLKEQPCADAISRQVAIDAIYTCYIGGKEAVDKAPVNDLYAEGIYEAVCAVEDLPSVSTKKTGRCKDCQYFQHDSIAIVDGIPLIVAHEICTTWGDGCKTREDGYCFMYTPKVESEDKV